MNYSKLQTTNILGATLIATVLECGPHWTGNEFVDSYLIQFDNGSTMSISTDRVGKDFFTVTDGNTPSVGAVSSHSFVLASLFDVKAMSLDIPDHVYESDPQLEWVTCPCCDGEKWLEVEGNVWTKALFSDHRRAYAHRALNHSYKVCGRCSGVGEVLDDLATPHTLAESQGQEKTPKTPETPVVVIKTIAQHPRSTPVSHEIFENTPIPLLPKLTKPLEQVFLVAA